MADYLAGTHPRAAEPTAPLWPSRKNGGGYRAEGKRYAVPFDWAQPLALGSFYDTIMKPALEAIGLPASRPATADAPATKAFACTTCGIRLPCATVGRRPLHAGIEMAGAQHLYADTGHIRRLHPRAGRRLPRTTPNHPPPVRSAAANVVPLQATGELAFWDGIGSIPCIPIEGTWALIDVLETHRAAGRTGRDASGGLIPRVHPRSEHLPVATAG